MPCITWTIAAIAGVVVPPVSMTARIRVRMTMVAVGRLIIMHARGVMRVSRLNDAGRAEGE